MKVSRKSEIPFSGSGPEDSHDVVRVERGKIESHNLNKDFRRTNWTELSC